MPKHNTLLGFDFGMRRIGVAVGQMITRTANPVAVLNARDGVPNWEHVQELIDTWNIDAIVVGIPLNMDGSKQPVTFAAQRFANKLSSRYGLPVYTVDERLTTVEAKRHQQTELDSYAAKLILEQWLREQDS